MACPLGWFLAILLMEVEEKWWCLLVLTVSEHMEQTLSLYCLSLLTSAADLWLAELWPGAAGLVSVEAVLDPEVVMEELGLGLDLLWSLVEESLTSIWGKRLCGRKL